MKTLRKFAHLVMHPFGGAAPVKEATPPVPDPKPTTLAQGKKRSRKKPRR